MAVYLLQNFGAAGKVLRYDDVLGRAEEIERSEDDELGEGFYVDPRRDLGGPHGGGASGEFAGYYETDRGPVFFRNDERWPLGGREFRGEVRRSDSGYEFTLWQGEERRLSLAYPGPLPDNFFFPEDEEYRDPFQWLAKYLPTPGFYACQISLTLGDARRIVATRAGQGSPEEEVRLGQAMVVLLEDGEAREQEEAAAFFLERGPALSLLRRLARSYAARGWDSGHPAVRLFIRYREWLGEGARAVLRRAFLSDPRSHAALGPALEPTSGH